MPKEIDQGDGEGVSNSGPASWHGHAWPLRNVATHLIHFEELVAYDKAP